MSDEHGEDIPAPTVFSYDANPQYPAHYTRETPTAYLRINRYGNLQQRWAIQKVDGRYNWVISEEAEWRDVPRE